ncbi:peroxiredoxin family protein [Effusibacillus consociatus]|uniref:Peroxiredoxin family protein n=1 Tax=Effusibacillus consociatus TaxID=1117041 RepID=A0ABV9Q1Q4_9BACL
MERKKVVVMALHSELESAYPPLNISVGAAASGAEVILAFARDGVDILNPNYIPIPSSGRGYLANTLSDFGAPTVQELLNIASECGVRMVVVDKDFVESNLPVESKPIKWILNEAASADLFVHF